MLQLFCSRVRDEAIREAFSADALRYKVLQYRRISTRANTTLRTKNYSTTCEMIVSAQSSRRYKLTGKPTKFKLIHNYSGPCCSSSRRCA